MKQLKNLFDEKLLKFILVGVVNTLVGMAIMFGLYNLAHCSYWVSSAANYILTSILSYFLNKYFTFKNKERSWKQRKERGGDRPLRAQHRGMLSFGLRHRQAAVSAAFGERQCRGT